MRILIVASELPPGPGGIGSHAAALAGQLVRRGHVVDVVAAQDYADDAEIASWTERQPFDVVRLGRSSLPGAAGSAATALARLAMLRRRLRSFTPDLVVASGERMVWLTALLSLTERLSPPPWLAIGHGIELGAPRSLRGRISRRAFSRANAVVCVSEHTRGAAERTGVTARLEVIPNGADEERFAPLADTVEADAFRRRHGLGSSRLLVTVGHLSRRKGQDLVVAALPALAARHDVIYLAIGLPTLRPQLEAQAAELSVGDRLRCPGVLPDDEVRLALAVADLFVMTSRSTADGDFEGYGIAVVEAALCGTPSVVAGASGLVEAVDGGATGAIVPPDDSHAVAEVVGALLSDEDRRHTLGEEARRRALGEKTWTRRVDRYEALFRELVEGRAR
ncbi:MAG: glycosyltransferase family 4 protein [Acidobacteriota bacterium]